MPRDLERDDLDSEDSPLEEGEDTEVTVDEANRNLSAPPAPLPVADEKPKTQAKPKGGRPRKHYPVAPGPPSGAQQAVLENTSDPPDLQEPGAFPKDASWPRDAIELWPRILLWGAGRDPSMKLPPGGQLLGPDDFIIYGEVIPNVGPFASADGAGAQRLAPIPGEIVAGSEWQDPGTALYDYLAENIQRNVSGSARYKLKFALKLGGRWLKEGYTTLGPYDQIVAQRTGQQRRMQQGLGAAPRQAAPYPNFQSPSNGYGQPAYPQAPYPQTPYYPPQAPYYPPQAAPRGMGGWPATPDPQVTASVEGMRRELAAMMGRLDAQQQQQAAAQLGLGAAPPPAAPMTPQDVAQIVVATLHTMGLGGAPVGAVAAPPPAGPQGISGAVAQAQGALSGLKEIVEVLKQVKGLETELGGKKNDEDEEPEPPTPTYDPTHPPFSLRPIPGTGSALTGGKDVQWPEVEEGLDLKWWTKFAMSNPPLAMTALEIVGKTLGEGAVGNLLKVISGARTAAPAASVGVGAVPPPALSPPTAPPPAPVIPPAPSGRYPPPS